MHLPIPNHLKQLKRFLFMSAALGLSFLSLISFFFGYKAYQNVVKLAEFEAKAIVEDVELSMQQQLGWMLTTHTFYVDLAVAHDPKWLSALEGIIESRPLIRQFVIFSDDQHEFFRYPKDGTSTSDAIASEIEHWRSQAELNQWQPLSSIRLPSDNAWLTPLVVWVKDHDDRSWYLLILLDGHYLERLHQTLIPDQLGSISVFSQEGVMLQRYPQGDGLIGRSFADGPLFSKLLEASPSGVSWAPTSTDGIRRLVVHFTPEHLPFVFTVGINAERILAPLEKELMLVGAGMVVLLVCLLWLAVRLNQYLSTTISVHNNLTDAKTRLDYLASTDELTSVSNRRSFLEILESECELRRLKGGQSALLMLDLDHFKMVNDHYGHGVGDQVLQTFVKRVRNHLKAQDRLGRYGGEEFLVLLKDIPEKAASDVAERLRQAVECRPVTLDDLPAIPLTVSIGMVMLNREYCDPTTILNQVDKALYEAKDSGRNKVVVHAFPQKAG